MKRNVTRWLSVALTVAMLMSAMGTIPVNATTVEPTEPTIVGGDGWQVVASGAARSVDGALQVSDVTSSDGYIPIITDYAFTFTLVRDAKHSQMVSELATTIMNRTKAEVFVGRDGAETKYEIVIGVHTDRPTSGEIYDEIVGARADHMEDYIIRMVGTKLYIVGANDYALQLAVDHFLETFVPNDSGKIPANYNYYHNPEHVTYMLAGQNVAAYTIRTERYPSQIVQRAAQALQQMVLDDCGYILPIKAMNLEGTDAGDNEIRIGPMNGAVKVERAYDTRFNSNNWDAYMAIDSDGMLAGEYGAYSVAFDGKNVEIEGGSAYAISVGVAKLITDLQKNGALGSGYQLSGNYQSGFDYKNGTGYDAVDYSMAEGFGLVYAEEFDYSGTDEEKDTAVRKKWAISRDSSDSTRQDGDDQMYQYRPGVYGDNWWVAADTTGNNYLFEITKKRTLEYEGSDHGWDSVRLVSAGFWGFKYGIWETRLVMGTRNGSCSAVWGSANSPYSSKGPWCEIDVYENYGRDAFVPCTYHSLDNMYLGNYHFQSPYYQEACWETPNEGEHYYDTFHHVSVDWNYDHINFYMDGELVSEMPMTNNEDFKYYRNQGIDIKLANGVGTRGYCWTHPNGYVGEKRSYNVYYWMGEENISKFFEVQLVDYTRVYQTDNALIDLPAAKNDIQFTQTFDDGAIMPSTDVDTETWSFETEQVGTTLDLNTTSTEVITVTDEAAHSGAQAVSVNAADSSGNGRPQMMVKNKNGDPIKVEAGKDYTITLWAMVPPGGHGYEHNVWFTAVPEDKQSVPHNAGFNKNDYIIGREQTIVQSVEKGVWQQLIYKIEDCAHSGYLRLGLAAYGANRNAVVIYLDDIKVKEIPPVDPHAMNFENLTVGENIALNTDNNTVTVTDEESYTGTQSVLVHSETNTGDNRPQFNVTDGDGNYIRVQKGDNFTVTFRMKALTKEYFTFSYWLAAVPEEMRDTPFARTSSFIKNDYVIAEKAGDEGPAGAEWKEYTISIWDCPLDGYLRIGLCHGNAHPYESNFYIDDIKVIEPEYVTVKFETNGAQDIYADQLLMSDMLIPMDNYIDPYREGYEFTGWYTDAECTADSYFNIYSTPVVGKQGDVLTLYAGWRAWESGGEPEEPSQPEEPDIFDEIPAELKGTTVIFADYGEAVADEYQKVLKKFTADTGIRVKMMQFLNTEYLSKVAQQIAAGKSPDVVVSNSTFPAALEVVQPLPSYFDLDDGFWDKRMSYAMMAGGKRYFVNSLNTPFAGGYVVYYNKALFNHNGLKTPQEYYDEGSWTWEVFKKAAKDCVQTGYKGAMFDPIIPAQQMDNALIEYDAASSIFRDVANDAGFIKALQYHARGLEEGVFSSGSATQFASGGIGMAVLGTYGLKYDGYFKDLLPSQIGVLPLPSSLDGQTADAFPTGCRGYGIAKGAQNGEAASYMLRYFLDLDKYEPADADIFANKSFEEYYRQQHLPTYQNSPLCFAWHEGVLPLTGNGWSSSVWNGVKTTFPSQILVEFVKMENVISEAAVAANRKLYDSTNAVCHHAYDNVCDADCNVCGEVREVEHTYSGGFDTTCDVCGAVRTIDAEQTGDCEWALHGTVLTISGNGVMGTYDYWNNPAPWGTDITEVIFEDGVTSIGDDAFYNCSGLTSITIPASVTSIGDGAFYDCNNLTNITLPAGLTSIGVWTFGYCSRLTSVTIPDGVTSIGDSAFFSSGLTSITIPDSVTHIGSQPFSWCDSLTSITVEEGNPIYYSEGNCLIETATKTVIAGCRTSVIPIGVTSIGAHAFEGCTGLSSITIPDGVASLGWGAFSGCGSLSSITIPDSVTIIDGYAFAFCNRLTSITIPDSVTSIGHKAFAWSENLTDIEMSANVTRIEEKLFCGCSGLTSITIPASVTSIGWGAFADCTGLTSITVEEGNTVYYSEGNCVIEKGTKTVVFGCQTSVIPDGVTSIGHYAFVGCSGLTSITLPKGVTSVGDGAFEGCSSLTDVWYGGSVNDKESIVVEHDNELLLNANWHYNACIGTADHSYGNVCDTDCNVCGAVRDAADHTYDYVCDADCNVCGEVREVEHTYSGGFDTTCDVCGAVRTIDAEQTGDCEWVLHGTVLTIGGNGAMGTYDANNPAPWGTDITEVIIEDGVTSIGASAFEGCKSITEIVIPDSVKSIGARAFYGCAGLTSVTLPNSIKLVGNRVFYGCSSLTSITIPDSVTNIGDYAFSASGLTSITLPASIIGIGYRAFYDASALTDVWYAGSKADRAAITVKSGNEYLLNAAWHYNACIGTAEHTYNHPCDAECGICGAEREPEHMYENACADYCYACGAPRVPSDHVYDNACDADCNECGAEQSTEHVYTTEFDTQCDVCGEVRTLETVSRLVYIGVNDGVLTLTYTFTPDADGGTAAVTDCEGSPDGEFVVPSTINGCPVTSIGAIAFEDCSSLMSVVIPDSVKSIGDYAFRGCSGLTSITIPDSVTSVGGGAFAGCSGLASLSVEEGNTAYYSEANCIIERNTKMLVAGCKNSVIPDGVTSIGHSAFSGCTDLMSVIIPDGVTYIEKFAFLDCSNLVSVTLPHSVTDISAGVFDGCISLTDVTLPANLKGINGNVFSRCSSLKSLTIPTGVAYIGDHAFSHCDSLTSIAIPNSVTWILSCAFEGCSSLTDVWYGGSVNDKESIVVEHDNELLLNATWHYAVCDHTYENACDADCNVCGEVREVPEVPEHVYDDDRDSTCNECGHIRPIEPIGPMPTFEVTGATARAGNTFTVDVVIRNNPGIVSFKLQLGYDESVLELISAEGVGYAGVAFGPTDSSPFIINWVDSLQPDNTTDGVVVTLTFRVKDDVAAGDRTLSLWYDVGDVFNAAYEDVYFDKVDGTVTVVDYISGDVNDDGAINNKDLSLLMRYLNRWEVDIVEEAADVNRDGILNNKDYSLLLQHLNGWPVELK